MTDQELLELAAKAAGIQYAHSSPGLGVCDDNMSEWWNPLTDDGDAMRLAVNLKITIMFDDASVWCEEHGVLEKYNGNSYAATRRAIVRAAAEIGGSMK